ncbi:MAG: HIG1 domain-containing protein [Rhizobiaceae bacterium]
MSIAVIYLLIGMIIAGMVLRKTWAIAQKGSASRSHQLMRFRVMAQFLVVAAIATFVFFTR